MDMARRRDSQTNVRVALLGLATLQVLLAAVGFAWWGWRAFASEPLPAAQPQLAAVVPRPVTLESAYPLARERADQWDRNADLILVSAQVDWPLDVPPGPVTEPPGGGWLTYVFVRERAGDDEALSLLIERYSGRIAREAVSSWGAPGPTVELDLLALATSSTDALLSAEAAGGTEFRRICPDARHQTRLSLGYAPLSLGGSVDQSSSGSSWLLGYRDVRDNGVAPLRIGVAVDDGGVVVETRTVPETDGCLS
jgi:hypothetical protein